MEKSKRGGHKRTTQTWMTLSPITTLNATIDMNTAEKAMLRTYEACIREQHKRLSIALQHPIDTLTVLDAAEFIQSYGKKIERLILKIDARNESLTSSEL